MEPPPNNKLELTSGALRRLERLEVTTRRKLLTQAQMLAVPREPQRRDLAAADRVLQVATR